MTAGQIVAFALKQCSIGNNGETATAQETNEALESLNMLMKAWNRKGLKAWLTGNQSITLVADKLSYTLGQSGADVTMDSPTEIISAYRLDSNNSSTQMTVFSREEYRMLSDKTTVGPPIDLYFQPTLTNSVLSVWPVPATADAAEYTIEINWKKPADDADATTNDLEFPPEWYLALGWGLAKQIMVGYDLPKERKYDIRSMAKEALKDAEGSDIGVNTSVFFQPTKRG